MPEFFSSDGNVVLQFLAIFSVIVVVMGAIYLTYRRFAGRGLSLSARAGNRSRQPRLGIVDIYELDRQRQLILLRRDNVEHLLLVGGPNDVVVERNVQRGVGARLPGEALARPDLSDEGAEADSGQRPLFPPSFEMPVVVSPPLPGSDRQVDAGAPPLDASLFEPDSFEVKPNDAQTARGRAGRILRRTPPPLVNPRPDVASARQPSAPGPSTAAPDAVPPVMPSGTSRTVDPAVLSDMARQLEVALRRPSSAVTPPPGQPAPKPEAPQAAPAPAASQAPAAPEAPKAPARPTIEPPRATNPVAAGMAASQALNPAQPPASTEAAEPAPAPRAPPPRGPQAPPPAPAPPTPPPAETKPAPPPPPKPAEPAPQPVAPAEAKPESPAPKPEPAPNPFSVEEIEAEFARLLGRPLDKKN